MMHASNVKHDHVLFGQTWHCNAIGECKESVVMVECCVLAQWPKSSRHSCHFIEMSQLYHYISLQKWDVLVLVFHHRQGVTEKTRGPPVQVSYHRRSTTDSTTRKVNGGGGVSLKSTSHFENMTNGICWKSASSLLLVKCFQTTFP